MSGTFKVMVGTTDRVQSGHTGEYQNIGLLFAVFVLSIIIQLNRTGGVLAVGKTMAR